MLASYSKIIGMRTISWLTKSGGVISADTTAKIRYDHFLTFRNVSAVNTPIAARNMATIGNSNKRPIGIVVMRWIDDEVTERQTNKE